jgi:hypothetical protein
MNPLGMNGTGDQKVLDNFIGAAMKVIAIATVLFWIIAILTYRT